MSVSDLNACEKSLLAFSHAELDGTTKVILGIKTSLRPCNYAEISKSTNILKPVYIKGMIWGMIVGQWPKIMLQNSKGAS
jgi:hypothetical protein